MKIYCINGLSLIELLVASVIFSIVMLGIYSAFQSGTLSYKNIEDNIDVYQNANRIFERINLDLRNSFSYSKEKTNFQGEKTKIEFLTIVGTFWEDKITQDIAYVVYKFEDNSLMRLCRKNQESLNSNSTVKYEEMTSDIYDLSFSYGYAAAPEKPMEIEWKELWDDTKELPQAIKVKLSFKNIPKKEFDRIIFLSQAG